MAERSASITPSHCAHSSRQRRRSRSETPPPLPMSEAPFFSLRERFSPPSPSCSALIARSTTPSSRGRTRSASAAARRGGAADAVVVAVEAEAETRLSSTESGIDQSDSSVRSSHGSHVACGHKRQRSRASELAARRLLRRAHTARADVRVFISLARARVLSLSRARAAMGKRGARTTCR
eukprot:7391327-Prymnesium_polylepis.1